MKPKTGLLSLPGVGKRVAQDLRDLGIDRPSCLKGKNPELLYKKLMRLRGRHIDRCMLYVFRCIVHSVECKNSENKKLQWWHFKS